MVQCPASSSSSALNALGASKRGEGHQSTAPARVTSAAVRQSESSAWSRIGAGIRSGAIFGGLVRELQEVRERLGGVDPRDQAGRARRGDEPEGETGGHPLPEAVRAHEQLADRVAGAGPARRLLDLALPAGL